MGAANRTKGARAPRKALAAAKAQWALRALELKGVLKGARSLRLSTRVDPGLMQAARDKLGAGSDTEVVTAALAVLAGGDDFGAWLVSREGRLPEDFELGF